jgi:hypothetical protein
LEKTYLAAKMGKYWVNIDIFKNLPNHLMPQPTGIFLSARGTVFVFVFVFVFLCPGAVEGSANYN